MALLSSCEARDNQNKYDEMGQAMLFTADQVSLFIEVRRARVMGAYAELQRGWR